MSKRARSRMVLGAGIPLVAAVAIAVLVFALSRIFLAVPENLAPWIALLFATNILIGCALAAAIPGRRSFLFLSVVLILTILAGGIAGAWVGEREIEPHVAEGSEKPGEPGEPPTGEPVGEPVAAVPIAAEGLAFDTDRLTLPSDSPVAIEFENLEAIPHNVAVYVEQGGEAIFQGEVVEGPTTIEYKFASPAAGEYYFQCDVHPNMNGTLTVE